MSFLLYSCRTDLQTRTVPNELWGVVFVAALPLVIADALIKGTGYICYTIIIVTCVYLFVYVLFRLGAFGGADA
ncbi:MAG: prepilin peptidase, partial [Methanosarcinales archaeon]|nr:prepilin peptidase [Methanosarcinales archaeon]